MATTAFDCWLFKTFEPNLKKFPTIVISVCVCLTNVSEWPHNGGCRQLPAPSPFQVSMLLFKSTICHWSFLNVSKVIHFWILKVRGRKSFLITLQVGSRCLGGQTLHVRFDPSGLAQHLLLGTNYKVVFIYFFGRCRFYFYFHKNTYESNAP